LFLFYFHHATADIKPACRGAMLVILAPEAILRYITAAHGPLYPEYAVFLVNTRTFVQKPPFPEHPVPEIPFTDAPSHGGAAVLPLLTVYILTFCFLKKTDFFIHRYLIREKNMEKRKTKVENFPDRIFFCLVGAGD